MSEEYSVGYSEGYQAGWNAAMDATPPAQPAPVPEGMRLVPVEPTQEMVKAFQDAMALEFGMRTTAGYHARVYSAMLAAAPAAQPAPVPLTARELELIDGMIEVQLDHAKRCDSIANRTMAERQKGWDMERVALLQKIRATPPAAPVQGPKEIAALVEGMEVSIDVSTGDHDSGNRLFGAVTLAQENQGSKHGLILLVQDPEANFKTATPPAAPVPIKPIVDPGLDANQKLAFKLGWKSAEKAHGITEKDQS
jgi:hypothetical protein